jgi:hypothetical protein
MRVVQEERGFFTVSVHKRTRARKKRKFDAEIRAHCTATLLCSEVKRFRYEQDKANFVPLSLQEREVKRLKCE